ncbi:MAG TPA: ATP-binding protein, partial [Thermoanaerobaculia bacterium]|nr:ATP-binding protein [Thermoanaerobaculia bacterium]
AAEVEAEELLEQALADLEAAIEESGAEVTHAPLPRIRADAGQIVQVLTNLIGNAIKFRGEEPPLVHVAAARTDDQWVFSVHDNGVGIEPAEAEAIFTSFKRLRPEVPGSGLGLSICKRVVERHGGHIWVKSEAGQGSTFFFTLPVPTEP